MVERVAVRLEAGDILHVQVQTLLDYEELRRLHEVVAQRIGTDNPILVTGPDIEFSTIKASDLPNEFIAQVADLVAKRLSGVVA